MGIRRLVHWAALGCGLMLLSAPARAADPDDFTNLAFEDLLDIEITSASRKAQRVQDTAAAVHVITQEDIRRSGHTSIPELLRMVPGVNVARNTNNSWSISIRGFQETFSRMLLVMIDGRSVYTPLFAGTYWDIQDMPLEEIDRIEIVRGPGASVWGSNAVNGVINIIRKKPSDDQGSYASVLGGTEDRLIANLGHGFALSEDLNLRVSGRFFDRDQSAAVTGHSQPDAWQQAMSHMRMDWQANDRDTLTLQGDWFQGQRDSAFRVDTSLVVPAPVFLEDTGNTHGGNVMFKWNRNLSEHASTDLQLYWDNQYRNEVNGREERQTFDGEFRNRFTVARIHDVNWGVGGRLMRDSINEKILNIQAAHDNANETIYNLFVQDEISVVDNLLAVTLGSKFEWNSYTGWEPQPTARFMLTPHEQHQFWGSVSRAARIPSRANRDLTIIFSMLAPTVPLRINPNPDFESEYMVAYELGYRTQPIEHVQLDLTGFVNEYDNLSSLDPMGPTPGDVTFGNHDRARAMGFELAAQWDVLDRWKLVPSWSFINISSSTLDEAAEDSAPHHQFKLNSYVNLPWKLELDTGIYYTAAVKAGVAPVTTIDGYWRYDARLGWHPTPALELSLVVQNAFDDQHQEFVDLLGSLAAGTSEIERNVYGKVTWRF